MSSSSQNIISSVPASVWANKKSSSSNTTASQRMPGTLVEVRRYVTDPAAGFGAPASSFLSPSQMLPSSSGRPSQGDGSNSNNGNNILIGFVMWIGSDDRRNNIWLPISEIFQTHDSTTPISTLKNTPLINEQLRAPVPADDRKRLWSQSVVNSELPFLEERLRRDCEVPPLVRSVMYLDHKMPAWYFSPLHVKFPEFSFSKAAQVASRGGSTSTKSAGAAAAAASSSSSSTSVSLVRSSFEEIYDAHVCPFSLSIFRSQQELFRWWLQQAQEDKVPPHPPGEVVYRDNEQGLTVYRVCGKKHHGFCTNLLLLARCFLESKLCGHEPSLYTFYVLTLDYEQVFPSSSKGSGGNTSGGAAKRPERCFAGYYSVERGELHHNLACIVVLPCFQARGLGRLLISLSYKIALAGLNVRPAQGEESELVTTAAAVKERRRKNTLLQQQQQQSASAAGRSKRSRSGVIINRSRYSPGTPERPLSDLGQAMYFRYWDQAVWSWVAKESTAMARAAAISVSSTPQNKGNTSAAAAHGGGDSSSRTVSLEELASEIEIAADDLRETILRLGMVHRTESKSLKLLLPQAFANFVVGKIDRMPNQLREECVKF